MPQRRGASNGGGKSKIPGLGSPKVPSNGAKNGNEATGEHDLVSEDGAFATILAKLEGFDTNFEELKTEVRDGLSAVNFKIDELSDKVKTVDEKSVGMKEEVRKMADTTTGLTTRAAVHGIRLAEVERKIEQLERDKRKNIIVIEGVIEDGKTSSPEIVELLFQDLKVGYDTMVCDRIYRRGKNPPATGENRQPEAANNNKRGERRPRPIVVGFKQLSDKIEIFKHLKNLQGNVKWERVYINDDLTECQQRQLRDLRSLSAYARSQGHRSSVRSSIIIVDESRYTYSDLGRLAPELTLEKAKTLVCLQGNGIAFQSEHAPLSNLYPCNIVYKSRAFLSAEGALQYTRAVLCQRLEEANAIAAERDPYEVKRIANTLKHSPEWEAIVVDVLIEILLIKFNSNPYCKQALLATGKHRLFEATGDKKWACGLPLSKIHELKLPIPGSNRTGEALEKVRGIITVG